MIYVETNKKCPKCGYFSSGWRVKATVTGIFETNQNLTGIYPLLHHIHSPDVIEKEIVEWVCPYCKHTFSPEEFEALPTLITFDVKDIDRCMGGGVEWRREGEKYVGFKKDFKIVVWQGKLKPQCRIYKNEVLLNEFGSIGKSYCSENFQLTISKALMDD